ncbi:MAG TPA: hypothetical protein VM243_14400 [Phycisphaerae bacterium]|nr:hypothetical protein [Phycisphaerae bacterium]
MLKRIHILTIVALAAPALVLGQSVNIDYGDGFGTPDETYAAAGLSGVWNTLLGPPDVPEALVGLDGEPIGATVTQDCSLGVFFIDDPETVGADQALMDDFLLGRGDIVVTLLFEGLENGPYEVITYAWGPASPEQYSAVWLDDDWEEGQVVGGPWPGGFEQGVTHAVHAAEVTDGTLRIQFVGAFWWSDCCVNGVQLAYLAPPPGDLNGDGCVDQADLGILLADWGCTGGDCPGDCDGDGDTDQGDLGILLAHWGEGCP